MTDNPKILAYGPDVRTNAANTTNSTDAEKEDGEKKKPKQKGEKHTVGQ